MSQPPCDAGASTSFPLVRKVVHLATIDSTSNYAREMLAQGTPDLPLLVWAREQTQGRGRGEHSWWSDAGSLTFTIVLDPDAHGLRPEQEPRLALMTAVAVIAAVGELGLSVPGLGIRWPNDVEANGRKLCGILPERVDVPGGRRLLIGVGLNVLSQLDQAPQDIRNMAASLSDLRAQPDQATASLAQVLSSILAQMEGRLTQLAAEDPLLAVEWNRLNLLKGQVVRVALGPRWIEGSVTEIDSQGALCVNDGMELHRLFGGQVLRTPR